MEALPVCPACGHHKFLHFTDTVDFSVTKEKFSLMKCSHCATLATLPQPDETEIQRYYQSNQYISHTNQSESRLISILYKTARGYALKRKRKLIEALKTKGCLLDIGCGTGSFLREMKNTGWKVYGVEPATAARRQAEMLLQQPLFESLEQAANLKVSVITMWHVLEHLHRPDAALKLCYECLEENGLLVMALPNYCSYDAQYYQNYWAGYDVPRHLWHFNQEAIRMLAERQGFYISNVLPMKLDSFYISLLSEKYFNGQKNPLARYIKALLSGIKSNIKAGKSGQYSSLIYLATKKNAVKKH